MDEGFPGAVLVEIYYRLNNVSNTLLIDFYANTTMPTPIDLTNHAYFNLAGHTSQERIYNHQIKIFSNFYLNITPDGIPTGELISVNATKYDLRNYTIIGDRVPKDARPPEEGFDHYFYSNQNTGNKIIAS